MELLREHYREQNRGQVQLAVFDLLGELLAVTLEKHDMEVVVDSYQFLQNQRGTITTLPAVQTLLEYEDVIEGHHQLKVTLSGSVQKENGLQDPFMLDFFIDWSQRFEKIKRSSKDKTPGINTLWLQFTRKEEQFMDALFTINIYRKKITGQQVLLGDGEGFLIFNKEQGVYVH